MKNFPFKHDDETLWYSRSIACSMYFFVFNEKDKKWYVLMSERGPGCPSAVGYWNVPGGYLDFDETLKQAAVRECHEETGFPMNGYDVKLAAISTNLNSKKQNVVCSFYTKTQTSDIDIFKSLLTTKYSESDEVTNIDFFPVDIFINGCSWLKVAFGHDKMIKEIFEKMINIGPLRRWLLNLTYKLTKINVPIE